VVVGAAGGILALPYLSEAGLAVAARAPNAVIVATDLANAATGTTVPRVAIATGAAAVTKTVASGGSGIGSVASEANRAEEIAKSFYDVASPQLQRTLSAPNLPVTFSAVTREGVTVINVNNPTVYKAFLEATEEGSVALQPGEFVGSPPIRSGTFPHPDWSSPFIHAETQGERELEVVFGLSGPGTASSFPNPGCLFCVPWLANQGITHLNPKP
jgi:hypothetical protein